MSIDLIRSKASPIMVSLAWTMRVLPRVVTGFVGALKLKYAVVELALDIETE